MDDKTMIETTGEQLKTATAKAIEALQRWTAAWNQTAHDRLLEDLRRSANAQADVIEAKVIRPLHAAANDLAVAMAAWLQTPEGQRFMALTRERSGG